MKRALFLSLLLAAALSGQNTAKFPGSAATTANLGVASNRAATTLTGNITSSTTNIPVASSSGFKAGSFVTIDNEQIAVCSIPDGTHLNAGVSSCPNTDGRGIDTANGAGAAASHSTNAPVQGRVVAWHINQADAEIVAIENKLAGPRAYGAKGDGSTDDSAAFASALSAGGGTIPITPGTYIIGTGLTMSTTNQRLFCEPGAILKAKSGLTSPIITITGTGNMIDGCTFDENSNTPTGSLAALYFNAAVSPIFRNNQLINANSATYGIRFSSTSGVQLYSNYLKAPVIFLDDGTAISNEMIANNIIDASANTGPSGVALQVANNSTGNVKSVAINGNVMTVGPVFFCVTVGQVSGGTATSSNFSIGSNTCSVSGTSSGSQAYGGYSLATVNQVTFTGNSFYGRGQYINIAALEAIVCNDCAISGNSLYGATDNSSTGAGMDLNGTPMTVTGNVVDGWAGGLSANAGVLFYTASAIAYPGVVFSGNTVIEGTTNNTQQGVTFSCRTSGASIPGVVFVGNNLIGSGGNQALNFTGSSTCGISYPIISGNQSYNWNNGVIASYTTNILQTANSYRTITTIFNDAGNNSIQSNINPGSLAIGKQTAPTVPLDVVGAGTITGLFQSSGGSYLTGGVSIGKTSAASSGMDVATTSSFVSNMCFSPTLAGYDSSICQDTTNTGSPILTFTSGDGTSGFRGRIQLLAGGTSGNGAFDFNSVDGVPIVLRDGNSNMLKCTPYYCILGNNSGIGIGNLPSCDAGHEGAMADVNDSNTVTWGATYTGSSTNHALVRCNGSAWTVVAK